MTEADLGLGHFDYAGDDHVVPFQVEGLDVRGRAVQLGPMLDAILERHNYPLPVARLVAETVVLTVLLGTSLKFEGKLIIQTKSNGRGRSGRRRFRDAGPGARLCPLQ